MASTDYSSSAQHPSLWGNGNQPQLQHASSPGAREQEAALLEETTAWIPPTPIALEARRPKSMKPVVVPRVDTAGRLAAPLPFMRAFSPDLQPHGVNVREFLAFVDNLAVAEATPAPLQALNMAGTVIGFVPHHWAMAAGTGMNVAAGVGTAAVTKTRTRRFLETVNREYFAPRGLKVSICKHNQLVERLGCGDNLLDSEPSSADLVHMSFRDRRMQALAPYIAPLSFDVPPPTEQRRLIDRVSAKQNERKLQKKKEKEEKEAIKMRHKRAERSRMQPGSDAHRGGYSSDSSSDSSLDSSLDYPKANINDANGCTRDINRNAGLDTSSNDPQVSAKEDRKKRKALRKAERREAISDRREAKSERKSERRDGKRRAKAEKKQDREVAKENEKAARMEFIVVEEMDLLQ